MLRKEFLENAEVVHILSPVSDDYSLCGDSLDIRSVENEPCGDLLTTKITIVTCERCKAIIKYCRVVKTKFGAIKYLEREEFDPI